MVKNWFIGSGCDSLKMCKNAVAYLGHLDIVAGRDEHQ